jgi:hypothetical protein
LGVSQNFLSISFGKANDASTEAALAGGFNTEVGLRKRDQGMTGLIKRKSHMPQAAQPDQAAAMTPES